MKRWKGPEPKSDYRVPHLHISIFADLFRVQTRTFDPQAEAKLRWKLDLFIIPNVFILYLFCFIDRTNIGAYVEKKVYLRLYSDSVSGNAKLAGFEKDLKLKGHDYNEMLSYFYISYILLEIPANVVCKAIGPGWFLPLSTVGFGVCSLCTAFVHGYDSASGLRFLLGVFESGMLPGIAYYLSRWYRRRELVFRLSMYIIAAPLAGAFGGLLASAILKLPNFGSLHTWRIIFAIEGIVTIVVGLITLVTLTDRPATARWLTTEEKQLAIDRIESERSTMNNRVVLDKIDGPKLLRGILCPVTLMTSVIFLLDNVTVQGLAIFAPTIVRTIYPKNSIISQQLHTVPPYIVGAFTVLAVSFTSWKTDQRNIFFMICSPFMITGYVMFLATTNPHVRYGASFLIAAGAFPFRALCNAQVAANVVSDTARSSAIATNVMFGNIGGLISTWSFLAWDAPNFRIGNGLNLATSTTIFFIALLMQFWMASNNQRRKQLINTTDLTGLSEKDVDDLEWKHPQFKWKP